MADYTISLAGIFIGISDLYPSTKRFFREYLCDASPQFFIIVRPEDIVYERKQAVLQNTREGLNIYCYKDWYLETLAIQRKIAERLFDLDIVLLHGSVIALEGKAYMFTAPSGTGKTTHMLRWLDLFPQAHVLNGDKPFLKVKANKTWACGTPWRGKEQYGENEILPLKAICTLEQGVTNQIRSISFDEAIGNLLGQMYRPEGSDKMIQTLRLCETMANSVKFYHLKCNMEQEAAIISSRAMLAVDNDVDDTCAVENLPKKGENFG